MLILTAFVLILRSTIGGRKYQNRLAEKIMQNKLISKMSSLLSMLTDKTYCVRQAWVRSPECYDFSFLPLKPAFGTNLWIDLWHCCSFQCYQWSIRPVPQIPRGTSPLSHEAPFRTRNEHTCAHFYNKMVHYGIIISRIVVFVRWVSTSCN